MPKVSNKRPSPLGIAPIVEARRRRPLPPGVLPSKTISYSKQLRASMKLKNNPMVWRRINVSLNYVGRAKELSAEFLDLNYIASVQRMALETIEAQACFNFLFNEKDMYLALRVVCSHHDTARHELNAKEKRRAAFTPPTPPSPKKPTVPSPKLQAGSASKRPAAPSSSSNRPTTTSLSRPAGFASNRPAASSSSSNRPTTTSLSQPAGFVSNQRAAPSSGPASIRPVVPVFARSVAPAPALREEDVDVDGAYAVQQFLSSCRPNMAHLLPHFLAFGLKNDECLYALSNRSKEATFDALGHLADHARLAGEHITEFQKFAIYVQFQAIA
ncbi:hypothetical protein GALMADRAFT_139561 [Galerina marginata CBS 339.88]|uniref:Uncharacterized protein n=1 Tax=Galerina marginata (strain CBS 339.88) TaxID=685588 RepID=A0A067T0D3_GALM3|nr:hypothetical protein GALMADRAFT_139561 [Galerina marginata CBS 339.88]